jgi:hypothetical protein
MPIINVVLGNTTFDSDYNEPDCEPVSAIPQHQNGNVYTIDFTNITDIPAKFGFPTFDEDFEISNGTWYGND